MIFSVKTDMPGGVIAVVQSFENIKKACIDKEEQAEIIVEFERDSKMSTLEVSHLVVKMIEMKDVTWKLDLRECSIGTSTAKKRYRYFFNISRSKGTFMNINGNNQPLERMLSLILIYILIWCDFFT